MTARGRIVLTLLVLAAVGVGVGQCRDDLASQRVDSRSVWSAVSSAPLWLPAFQFPGSSDGSQIRHWDYESLRLSRLCGSMHPVSTAETRKTQRVMERIGRQRRVPGKSSAEDDALQTLRDSLACLWFGRCTGSRLLT